MIRRLLLTTASVVMLMALSSVARADTITLTGINGTGVTATITNFTLVGNQFTFTINNTSVAPGSTGTITNIGFDLAGNRPNTFSILSSTNSNYAVRHDLNATAGAQNFVSTFDVVLWNGNGNATFGGGSVNRGIAGGTSATFTVTGDFSGLTADQIARAIYARFQAVNGGDSDVGRGNPNAPIPEPMTMLLLGTGLAGVAAKVRRQRRKA